MSLFCFATRRACSKSARIVPILLCPKLLQRSVWPIRGVSNYQSSQTPSRAFSFKFARPRFASVAATVKSPPSLQPLGPFPYPASEIPLGSPISHVKLKAEQEKAEQEKANLESIKDSPPILPQTSFDERRVAVGWDASTWSKLYVNTIC